MIYEGACHCGAVRAKFETASVPRLRFDGCSFCARHGVKSASDAKGSLRLDAEVPLTRYRFGHRTADFLICPVCGVYIATCMDGPNGPVGVINVVGLDIPQLRDLTPDQASFEGETEDTRRARRLSRWTPMTLSEPNAEAGAGT